LEDIDEYGKSRSQCKQLRIRKRKAYIEKMQEAIIEEAETEPYKAIRPRQQRFQPSISMDTWETHISRITCAKESRPKTRPPDKTELLVRITEKEVIKATKEAGRNRTPGPDGIRNEHIKEAMTLLLPTWTALLNNCLELGQIPTEWKKSTIKLIYKGRGDTCNPNTYRGIALESNALKLLTRILAKGVASMLDPVLPEEQFGYRPRRSTLLAAESFLPHIRTDLENPRGKLYAVFVDYSKAFDLVHRELTINKLEGLIGRTKLTTLMSNILAYNQIQTVDGIGKSQRLIQTNGVLQGDPLSPLLFNALTHDVGAKIKEETDTVIYMYADDMALVSETIPDLQKTVDLLSIWAQTNEIKINEEKTELVLFRKGGK
jgi:hypothetical protein